MKHILVALALAASALFFGTAQAACPTPNPNATAIPGAWIDNCPIPAAALNGALTQNGRNAASFNVVYDGITDNSTALQAALTWLGGTPNAMLVFSPGTVYTSTGVSVTPNVSATIVGAGADLTFFKGPATGGNLLTVNESTANQSFHLRDFTVLAAGANTGTAIKLVQSGAIASPANSAQSDISNVTIRGADAYAGSDCFAVGVDTGYTSNINFINFNYTGCNSPSAEGIGVNLSGNATYSGVVYNFIGATLNYCNYGIEYGNHIQGVTVGQSNSVGCNKGIYVPSGLSNTGQLTVSNSSFGDAQAIDDQTGVPYAVYSGNYVVIPAASDIGFNLGICNNCVSMGNKFLAQSSSSTTGLYVAGTGVSLGDLFSGANIGVNLVGGGSAFNVRGPIFSSNTTDVSSTCTNCLVSGINLNAAPATATVTGAISDGGDVELTVSPNTNSWVADEVMTIGGVGGVAAVEWAVTTPITIVDSTHILLPFIAFSGSYTSGGFVSPAP